MRQYISESEAVYQDKYHGLFSRKLAEWAISRMEIKDTASRQMKRIVPRSLDDVQEILVKNDIEIQDEFIYTGWYLFMMAMADYPKTLTTDAQRAMFANETINDPDGCPENVLDCFVAKMRNANVPIYWEKYL